MANTFKTAEMLAEELGVYKETIYTMATRGKLERADCKVGKHRTLYREPEDGLILWYRDFVRWIPNEV